MKDSKDWRDLAEYQSNVALGLQDTEQKLLWYEKAMLSLLHVPEKEFGEEDWRMLAKYQNNIGFSGNHKSHPKSDWYKKAVNSLSNIQQERFVSYDWRNLALYQNNISTVCDDPVVEKVWIEKALASITRVPEKEFTFTDWRNLARYQNNYGVLSKDHVAKSWHEKAIYSLIHIPEKERTSEDWDEIGQYQNNVAATLAFMKDWINAQNFYLGALDSYSRSPEQMDYKCIAKIFKHLCDLSHEYTLEQHVYGFARQIFSGSEVVGFESQLLRFHRSILGSSQGGHTLLRAWPQFLRLLDTARTQTTFPNDKIKQWLNDNSEVFKQMLQSAEQAYSPLSLLNMIDQTPTFSVAIAQKIMMLERTIDNLNDKIQHLQNENEQLRTNQNHYQSQLTLFEKNHSSCILDQTTKKGMKRRNLTAETNTKSKRI